jgi:hypothetical protein
VVLENSNCNLASFFFFFLSDSVNVISSFSQSLLEDQNGRVERQAVQEIYTYLEEPKYFDNQITELVHTSDQGTE